MTESPH